MPNDSLLLSCMVAAGRGGGLVHLGEKECNEWCKEQRMHRARSQALLSTSSGTSMGRQGSVLVMGCPLSCSSTQD